MLIIYIKNKTVNTSDVVTFYTYLYTPDSRSCPVGYMNVDSSMDNEDTLSHLKIYILYWSTLNM